MINEERLTEEPKPKTENLSITLSRALSAVFHPLLMPTILFSILLFAAPGAIGAWGQGWAGALQQLSSVVGATAGNAAAAADAYTVTDTHAMPAARR